MWVTDKRLLEEEGTGVNTKVGSEEIQDPGGKVDGCLV